MWEIPLRGHNHQSHEDLFVGLNDIILLIMFTILNPDSQYIDILVRILLQIHLVEWKENWTNLLLWQMNLSDRIDCTKGPVHIRIWSI